MYNEYIKMNEKSDDVEMDVRAKNDVVQNFIKNILCIINIIIKFLM